MKMLCNIGFHRWRLSQSFSHYSTEYLCRRCGSLGYAGDILENNESISIKQDEKRNSMQIRDANTQTSNHKIKKPNIVFSFWWLFDLYAAIMTILLTASNSLVHVIRSGEKNRLSMLAKYCLFMLILDGFVLLFL